MNELLVVLREILADVRVGKGTKFVAGICHEIDARMCAMGFDECRADLAHGMFTQIARRWPHFSGDKTYPIPGGSHAYWDAHGPTYSKQPNELWRGTQLGYRIDLMQFVIKQLEEELEREKLL